MNTRYALRAIAIALLVTGARAEAQSLTTIRAGNAVAGIPAPGNDLVRHWIVSPGVTCNDGTTPAAYVRRATNVANRDNWIIFLQGGGSCGSGEECLERWQSFQSNYGIQKMSTSIPAATWNAWHPAMGAPNGWTLQGANYAVPNGIVGSGIFNGAAGNPFSAWNKVFLNYCSSDSWIGQQPGYATTGTDNLGTPPVLPGTVSSYTIPFQGALIFDALINDLRAGVNYCKPEGGCETLRSLNQAGTVLLTGSSAGGNGVKHNLDRFRAQQNAINGNTEVRGVIDAVATPDPGLYPWPVPPATFTSAQERIEHEWNDVYLPMWMARVDDSCLALNTGVVASRCGNTTHVLRHHITTPFFQRMDLQDENTLDNYRGFYPPPYGPTMAPRRLAIEVADQLRQIGDYGTELAPRYPVELATIAADPMWISPGVWGPRCTDHVGLDINRVFFSQELPTPAGALVNFADTLFQWVTTPPPGLGGGTGPVLIENLGVGPVGFAQCN